MEDRYPTKDSIMGTLQRYVRGDGTVTWFVVDEETFKYISWCEYCFTYGVTRSHRLCAPCICGECGPTARLLRLCDCKEGEQ